MPKSDRTSTYTTNPASHNGRLSGLSYLSEPAEYSKAFASQGIEPCLSPDLGKRAGIEPAYSLTLLCCSHNVCHYEELTSSFRYYLPATHRGISCGLSRCHVFCFRISNNQASMSPPMPNYRHFLGLDWLTFASALLPSPALDVLRVSVKISTFYGFPMGLPSAPGGRNLYLLTL